MNLGLRGRTALVTGGSRGIGRAIARGFLAEGVRTVVTSRDLERARQAATDLAAEPSSEADVVGVEIELGDINSVAAAVRSAEEHLGRIDILVNCGADVSGHVAEDFDHVTDVFVAEAFNVKFLGALRCSQAVVPGMRKAGWGRIITIGGHTARHAGAISAGARNSALVNMTVALAHALGADGINATIVHPAATVTESFDERMAKVAGRRGTDVATHVAALAGGNAIRRLVDATEVADVVTFLASPRSAGITGEVIAVTGGAGPAVHA